MRLRSTIVRASGLVLLATCAHAQVPTPACPSGPALLRAARELPGESVRLWWEAAGCEAAVERSPDPRFPDGVRDRLTDPLLAPTSSPWVDSAPPSGLVYYRLDESDGAWPFWEACRRSSDREGGQAVMLRYDDGVPSIAGFGLGPGDIEAVHFQPATPLVLERIQAYFFGAPGPVEIRLWADFGGSWPDEARLLTDPIVLPTVTTDTWTEIDISDRDIRVHPNEEFWVGYVHVGSEPVLVLDDGANPSHSKVKDPDTTPPPFVWSSWAEGNEYLLRVEGRTFCAVDRPMFADRTDAAGLTGRNEAWISWGDANGDRFDDLLLSGPVLLLNDRAGGFLDATATAGLERFAPTGAFGVWADVDNDRDQDLFLGTWTNQPPQPGDPDDVLLLNSGFGTFIPVEPAGVEGADTTTTATLGDYDGDGNLDLFTGNWLEVWPDPPSMLDRLYLGNGDGTFVESTLAAGLGDQGPLNRPTYAVSSVDFDDDGDLDLYAGTYGHEPDYLWENQLAQGSFTFVEAAAAHGLAEDAMPPGGLTYGGDWGDFDGDGDLDAIVARIAHPRVLDFADPTGLHVNGGAPEHVFTVETAARGIGYHEGGLDASWVDFDNDGDLDAYVSNVYPLQHARLYRQDGDGTFTDVTYESGIRVTDCLGHGWADHDRDGDLDLALANEGPGSHVWLFENLEAQDRSWLTVRLEGRGCFVTGECNCGGVGARVHVTADGRAQLREVASGKGHANSQASLPVEFGLGDATAIDELRVRWPCGAEETYAGARPNSFVLVREGQAAVVEE